MKILHRHSYLKVNFANLYDYETEEKYIMNTLGNVRFHETRAPAL